MKKIAISLIKAYKKIIVPLYSNVFGDVCRFSPTCSEYAIISIEKEGIVKGSYMAIQRILKCQPFYKPNIVAENKYD